MDSVRVLWTDLRHNRCLDALGAALRIDNRHELLGLYWRFTLGVAHHHQDGILARAAGELEPRHLAELAGWPWEPEELYQAMRLSGVLCSPAQFPEEHGRCGFRPPPPYKGAPRQVHAQGLIAVHEWDRIVGPDFRRRIEAIYRKDRKRGRDRAQKRLPLGSRFHGRRRPPGVAAVGAAGPGDPAVVSRLDLGWGGRGIAGSDSSTGMDRRVSAQVDPAIHPPAEPEKPPEGGPNCHRKAIPAARANSDPAIRAPSPSLSDPHGSPAQNRVFPASTGIAGGGVRLPPTPTASPSPPADAGRGHVNGRANGNGRGRARGNGPLEEGGTGPIALREVLDVPHLLEPLTPRRWEQLWQRYQEAAATKGLSTEKAHVLFQRQYGPKPKE